MLKIEINLLNDVIARKSTSVNASRLGCIVTLVKAQNTRELLTWRTKKEKNERE